MIGKIINNSEPDFKENQFEGKCPKYCKEVKVTVRYSGRKTCKTDLQKSYTEVGRKCSLLVETEKSLFALCMENCPLVRK